MALKDSRFAPRTTAESIALSRADRDKQEKETAIRLFSRLRWKAESLRASYTRAMDILHAEVDQNGYLDRRGEQHYPFAVGLSSVSVDQFLNTTAHRQHAHMQKKQAESMFKVDFFEFYTLLERYITLCLSVLGVSVSASAPRTSVNALRFITNPDFARSRPEATHQFHANLLEALDKEDSPLHAALGNQEVRIQLSLAKEYRNRWKDADEHVGTPRWDSEDLARKSIKLEDLDLLQMLATLLTGCEQALAVVRSGENVANGATYHPSRDYYHHSYDASQMSIDTPIEYMEDAMDLD